MSTLSLLDLCDCHVLTYNSPSEAAPMNVPINAKRLRASLPDVPVIHGSRPAFQIIPGDEA